MRAVAELIVSARIARNKTLTPDHARESQETTIQIGMAANSAVDQRDSDAGAGVTGLPRGERIHGRRGVAEGGSQRAIEADVYDIREVHNAGAVEHRN